MLRSLSTGRGKAGHSPHFQRFGAGTVHILDFFTALELSMARTVVLEGLKKIPPVLYRAQRSKVQCLFSL